MAVFALKEPELKLYDSLNLDQNKKIVATIYDITYRLTTWLSLSKTYFMQWKVVSAAQLYTVSRGLIVVAFSSLSAFSNVNI